MSAEADGEVAHRDSVAAQRQWLRTEGPKGEPAAEVRKARELELGLDLDLDLEPGTRGPLESPRKVAKERADRQEEQMTLGPGAEPGSSPGRPELTIPGSWSARRTEAGAEEDEAGRPRSGCGRGSWQTRQELIRVKNKRMRFKTE